MVKGAALRGGAAKCLDAQRSVMSGRRIQSRVAFVNSRGVLRVSRDVIIEKVADSEFVAVSGEPSVPGDVLTIAFSTTANRETQTVRVMTSRPIVVGGVVKHELRLERVDDDAVTATLGALTQNRGAND
jgi:hypothetical protein